jgi:hypothetical protein
MALPSSTYDIATISNPSSALTDFTLIVDLSTMSSAWWSAVDTSDGTKGRASKGDGTTELACDWIDFDDTAETGILRVKWSGTLASTGTQQVRIYPPQAANASYAATDTYGQYNAYDSSWEVYYPLVDLNDRTSNQNTLTLSGDAYLASGTGFYGGDLVVDGSGDYASGANITATELTIITTHRSSWTYWGGLNGQFFRNINNNHLRLMQGSSTTTSDVPSIDVIDDTHRQGSTAQWNYLAGVIKDSTGFIYLNGSTLSTTYFDSTAITARTDIQVVLGRSKFATGYATGIIGSTSLHSTDRSESWVSQEYSQTSDNATFWGTWTNVPVSSGYSIDLDTGTFTLTGSDIDLLKGSVIDMDTGSFSLTGEDVSFLRNYVIELAIGSFTFTGRNIALIYSGDVPVRTGGSPLGYRPYLSSDIEKRAYYINQILWGT